MAPFFVIIEQYILTNLGAASKFQLTITFLPVREVNIDKNQMQQVFLNLLINSFQAMEPFGKGKIIISISGIDEQVEIRITDTGEGIDEDNKNNIFNPFFTTKGAFSKNRSNFTGTGLGLSVLYQIIKSHGGNITFESEKGKGTTFIIKLPLAN